MTATLQASRLHKATVKEVYFPSLKAVFFAYMIYANNGVEQYKPSARPTPTSLTTNIVIECLQNPLKEIRYEHIITDRAICYSYCYIFEPINYIIKVSLMFDIDNTNENMLYCDMI